MSDNVIVLVSDLDTGKHGEVNVFESHEEAAHLIESLLESGFEQERIRVFTGSEMEMHVTHRPVVALVGGDASSGHVPAEREAEEEDEEEALEEPVEEREPVAARAQSTRAEIKEEVSATPFVKDGVRFSSLFRPA